MYTTRERKCESVLSVVDTNDFLVCTFTSGGGCFGTFWAICIFIDGRLSALKKRLDLLLYGKMTKRKPKISLFLQLNA